jgi:hypothetical protein
MLPAAFDLIKAWGFEFNSGTGVDSDGKVANLHSLAITVCATWGASASLGRYV